MILASIAMEESGCNKDTVGGAGEQGIMQITKDKCPNQIANATWYVKFIIWVYKPHIRYATFCSRDPVSSNV